jgi:hypothetical protein
LVLAATLLVPAALAQAKIYCVNITGPPCDVEEGTSFQQALDDAKNNPGPDTVKLGSAPLSTPVGFSYVSPDPVAIQGKGGRDAGLGASAISDSSTNPSGHVVLTVRGSSASTISGLAVVAPGGTGSGNVGIDTNGTVGDVLVQTGSPASSFSAGVELENGGAVTGSDIFMSTATQSFGVLVVGTGTAVDDSRIEAVRGYSTGGAAAISGSVRRVQITSSIDGIGVDRGDFSAEDVLMLVRSDNAFAHEGATLNVSTASGSLALNHVTIVGANDSGLALNESASGGFRADLTFRNGVIVKHPTTFSRFANTNSTANLTTDYSDYATGMITLNSGAGSITETNHLTSAPGFDSDTDFRLRSDSPLIDAGDPSGLGASESATDLSGQPRITDGDGNCSARRDIGAYEFQPGPRAPHAAASAAPGLALTGQPVTFDSAGSCDADGDPLTYSWTFDDGGGAPGASVQRTFSTPGLHFGAVTVSDSSGRSATAAASVRIAFPPFNGVTIAQGKFRASKKGAVKLKLTCAGGTAGFCAGTLSFDGARAAFSIPPGSTRSVTVKLPRSKLKTLRRKKKQKLIATAAAHDANGTGRTSSAKLTLLASR